MINIGGFENAMREYRDPCNTAVLNVAAELIDEYDERIVSVRVPLLDRSCNDPSEAPINSDLVLITAAEVLDLLQQAHASVLVHCRNGISRAPAVVALWHVLYRNNDLHTALEIVRAMRAKETKAIQAVLFNVRCPHVSFVRQLERITRQHD